MPDTDDPTYRLRYRATGDDIRVREPEEVEGGEDVFEVRLPIATTGQVRNDGDDPLTRDELNGMARQLKAREIGVFPAHGSDSMIAAGRYSPFEKLGVWAEASIDSREEENVLMATARMPDPETLPAATGEYRQALAILKEQAKRGIAQDASIGWRDDEDFQGGVDLMEASIVGIGADWRTNTGDEQAEVVARAAVDAGADPEALIETVRSAVEEGRPLGPPGDEDRFESFEECVDALSDDPDTSREDAEEICGAWEAAKDGQSHDMTESTDPDEGTDTDEQDAADEAAETQDDSPEKLRQSPAELADMAEDLFMAHAERAAEEFREELEEMMGDGEEAEMDGDEDDEDEDDDGEMSADDPDEEQDADADDASDLESRIAELETELQEARDGGLSGEDIEEPETDGEQDADADGDETEQRDTTDGADAATAGPNWRGD
jgi:hypothetical protein